MPRVRLSFDPAPRAGKIPERSPPPPRVSRRGPSSLARTRPTGVTMRDRRPSSTQPSARAQQNELLPVRSGAIAHWACRVARRPSAMRPQPIDRDLAIAFILRQTPAPWPRSQGLQSHQSFDPVQTTVDAVCQQVTPDPSCGSARALRHSLYTAPRLPRRSTPQLGGMIGTSKNGRAPSFEMRVVMPSY
jgi:hypothetical protein